MSRPIIYNYEDDNKRNLRALFVMLSDSLQSQRELPKKIDELNHLKFYIERTGRDLPTTANTEHLAPSIHAGLSDTVDAIGREIADTQYLIDTAKQDFDQVLERLDAVGETWFNRSLTVNSTAVGPFIDTQNNTIKHKELGEFIADAIKEELGAGSFRMVSYRENDHDEPKVNVFGESQNEYELLFSSIHEDNVLKALGRLVSNNLAASEDIPEDSKSTIVVDGEERTITSKNGVEIHRALGFSVDGMRGNLSYYFGKFGNLDHHYDRGMTSVANSQFPFLKPENFEKDDALMAFKNDKSFGGGIGRTIDGYNEVMHRLAGLYLKDHGHEFNISKLKATLHENAQESNNELSR